MSVETDLASPTFPKTEPAGEMTQPVEMIHAYIQPMAWERPSIRIYNSANFPSETCRIESSDGLLFLGGNGEGLAL